MGIKETGEGKRTTSGECSLTQTFSTWLATTKGNGGDDGCCCCLSVWRTVCACFSVTVLRGSDWLLHYPQLSIKAHCQTPGKHRSVFHVFVVAHSSGYIELWLQVSEFCLFCGTLHVADYIWNKVSFTGSSDKIIIIVKQECIKLELHQISS